MCDRPPFPPAATHVEVVRRLEEVVQLDNVGVALRDLLEDLDLVADLPVSALPSVPRDPRGHIPCAHAPAASAHILLRHGHLQ
jgi:hypothetical protein